MRAPGWAQDTPTPTSGAALDEHGALHCQCGNTPDFDGFSPVDKDGHFDDDLLDRDAEPGTLHYLCERCGLMFGPWPSVKVAGYFAFETARKATCQHCERTVTETPLGWADLEATGDDNIWRYVCDSHDTLTAEHVPA